MDNAAVQERVLSFMYQALMVAESWPFRVRLVNRVLFFFFAAITPAASSE